MALPPHMRADHPAAADPARRRLIRTSSLRLPSLPSRPSKSSLCSLPTPSSDNPTDDILIDDASPPPPAHDKDVYRWAVLYENQRGVTLFSTPFYSPLSLLPSDPDPFTLPNAARASCPDLSLENYPLPDGTWRWVSTAWMIDMRSDCGEVQYDGFEYNWSFRGNSWHANVGRLGAGAWVRRRRWLRLMMRPAARVHHSGNHSTVPLPSLTSPSLVRLASNSHLDRATHLWDGTDRDWQHVHRLLRRLGRDGRKLELWRLWLGPYAHTRASDVKGKRKQSDVLPPSSQRALEKCLSDIVPESNHPPLRDLITLFRNHGEAILHSFVFPDSRARFLDLARQAGLAEDLESCLGHAFSAADVDFWSYAEKLDKLVDPD